MDWPLEITAIACPAGLRLRGEIDISTLPSLELALELLHAQGGDVVLDLTDLTFIDVAGLRTLAYTAAALTATGRRLHLAHPSPQLCRLAGLLGWPHLVAPPPPPEPAGVASRSVNLPREAVKLRR
jgi:anti-anti-sigma factor